MKPKLLIGLALVSLYVVSCSHPGPLVMRRHYNKVQGVEASYDLPVVYNERVQRWIDYFRGENWARFSVYLTRSGRFVPMMREMLKDEGLPQDLVYLAMIESGFSTHAYSRAHAVGPWQFIRSTGRIYDLAINSWVDERRDPEKSTRAAIRYLKKLYGDFGDWYLALAAYNAGEGRVFRAVRQSGSRDFWQIAAPRRHYLRPETKEYVPKFLAALIIAKNPERFGFGHVRYEEPLAFETVRVRGPLGLDVAGDLAGGQVHEVRRLNPELTLGMTPHGSYTLKIPPGTKQAFQLALVQLPPEEKVRLVYHTVRRGDAIWKIARRYGVGRDDLLAANNLTLRKARYLKVGQSLVVPKQGRSPAASARAQPDLLAYNDQASTPKQKRLDGVEYMIRKDFKENGAEAEVRQAAQRETPVVDLEGFKQADLPKVEERDLEESIQPPGPQPEAEAKKIEYVVKRGDNLWRIARKHGVKVSDLKDWNNLSTNQIRPGKSLLIAAP